MVERLDEERLETLRAWGAGLSTNARDELRAAGKAILMLVDEIDRLEADLWNARASANLRKERAAEQRAAEQRALEERAASKRVETQEERETPVPAAELALTLGERIARGRAPSEPAT